MSLDSYILKDRQGLIVDAYQRGLAKPPAVTSQSPRKAENNDHKKLKAVPNLL
jgi:hypothetical protein